MSNEYDYSGLYNHTSDGQPAQPQSSQPEQGGYPNVGSSGMNTANTARTDYSGNGASPNPQQDPNGYIYVNPMTNGIEIEPNSYVKVGSIDPKYTLGWHNSFSWKGLNLGFLIDARVGGVVVSGTEAMMDQYGVSKSTARDRDNGGAIVNGGRMDAKTFYSVAASGTTGVLSNYVYSATNVRLRELSLSYTLPALARERLRITLSLIANNVLMLHNEAPFDPELTSNTGTYYQGFDYFMPPSLRSWGFGVKVNF